jgi:hypothetical protein
MEGKDMDVDSDEKDLRRLVMDTPRSPQLPQTNEYSLAQFYVRDCYDTYYMQAMHLLKTYKLISITGTKGIADECVSHDYSSLAQVLESPCFTSILTTECERNIQIGL